MWQIFKAHIVKLLLTLYDSQIYPPEDGAPIFFDEAWVRVISYDVIAVAPLHLYFKIFVIYIPLHYAIVAIIKICVGGIRLVIKSIVKISLNSRTEFLNPNYIHHGPYIYYFLFHDQQLRAFQKVVPFEGPPQGKFYAAFKKTGYIFFEVRILTCSVKI